MPYQLTEVTVRSDNTPEGLAQIAALWQDISSGKLPLLFDSAQQFQPGVSPVSRYSRYASDETGAYDLSVLAVTADFFQRLESETAGGLYRKFEASDETGDLGACAQKAWEQVWSAQKSGGLNRSFTADYESTVPAQYTKDGNAHCCLYIAVC